MISKILHTQFETVFQCAFLLNLHHMEEAEILIPKAISTSMDIKLLFSLNISFTEAFNIRRAGMRKNRCRNEEHLQHFFLIETSISIGDSECYFCAFEMLREVWK